MVMALLLVGVTKIPKPLGQVLSVLRHD
jgi:hypothetical protein